MKDTANKVSVIPADAGIQSLSLETFNKPLDSRLRASDY